MRADDFFPNFLVWENLPPSSSSSKKGTSHRFAHLRKNLSPPKVPDWNSPTKLPKKCAPFFSRAGERRPPATSIFFFFDKSISWCASCWCGGDGDQTQTKTSPIPTTFFVPGWQNGTRVTLVKKDRGGANLDKRKSMLWEWVDPSGVALAR